jgi:2'-5' RNA ligase
MDDVWDDVDYYCAVIFPSLPAEPIASFRRVHDPTVDLIAPHLTLVFPTRAAIGARTFSEHVRRVASQHPPFDICLTGLEESWDHWLFLVVAEGREEAIALHDGLYQGILSPNLRTDLPYVPHVGLGLFAEPGDDRDLLEVRPRALDRPRFEHAWKDAEAMQLDYRCRVSSIHVVGLDEGLTRLTMVEDVPLGST